MKTPRGRYLSQNQKPVGRTSTWKLKGSRRPLNPRAAAHEWLELPRFQGQRWIVLKGDYQRLKMQKLTETNLGRP